MDWLWAALLGIGGSVVGGAVGGWFVLIAGHRQSKRDRENASLERSHQAAFEIADAIAGLMMAVAVWQHQPDHDHVPLVDAFNIYARTVSIQSMALADPELRRRVKNQTGMTMAFLTIARQGGTSAVQLADAARRHSTAVIAALDAYINIKALPPYEPPDLERGTGLINWGLESS